MRPFDPRVLDHRALHHRIAKQLTLAVESVSILEVTKRASGRRIEDSIQLGKIGDTVYPYAYDPYAR